MAAKGTIAKQNLANAFMKAIPGAYVGTSGGKYYFNMQENGETLQIAVSMSVTKNPITAATVIPTVKGGLDFENATTVVNVPVENEITEQEKETVENLMKQLGLL